MHSGHVKYKQIDDHKTDYTAVPLAAASCSLFLLNLPSSRYQVGAVGGRSWKNGYIDPRKAKACFLGKINQSLSRVARVVSLTSSSLQEGRGTPTRRSATKHQPGVPCKCPRSGLVWGWPL